MYAQLPMFIMAIAFESSTQSKDALEKYLVVECKEIKFIKNYKKFVGKRTPQMPKLDTKGHYL